MAQYEVRFRVNLQGRGVNRTEVVTASGSTEAKDLIRAKYGSAIESVFVATEKYSSTSSFGTRDWGAKFEEPRQEKTRDPKKEAEDDFVSELRSRNSYAGDENSRKLEKFINHYCWDYRHVVSLNIEDDGYVFWRLSKAKKDLYEEDFVPVGFIKLSASNEKIKDSYFIFYFFVRSLNVDYLNSYARKYFGMLPEGDSLDKLRFVKTSNFSSAKTGGTISSLLSLPDSFKIFSFKIKGRFAKFNRKSKKTDQNEINESLRTYSENSLRSSVFLYEDKEEKMSMLTYVIKSDDVEVLWGVKNSLNPDVDSKTKDFSKNDESEINLFKWILILFLFFILWIYIF